jgi:hypothetical protein
MLSCSHGTKRSAGVLSLILSEFSYDLKQFQCETQLPSQCPYFITATYIVLMLLWDVPIFCDRYILRKISRCYDQKVAIILELSLEEFEKFLIIFTQNGLIFKVQDILIFKGKRLFFGENQTPFSPQKTSWSKDEALKSYSKQPVVQGSILGRGTIPIVSCHIKYYTIACGQVPMVYGPSCFHVQVLLEIFGMDKDHSNLLTCSGKLFSLVRFCWKCFKRISYSLI